MQAAGIAREKAAASELPWAVGSRESAKDSSGLESQRRLHECGAAAGGQAYRFCGEPVRIRVPAFLLPDSRLQLNGRLDGIWLCDDSRGPQKPSAFLGARIAGGGPKAENDLKRWPRRQPGRRSIGTNELPYPHGNEGYGVQRDNGHRAVAP